MDELASVKEELRLLKIAYEFVTKELDIAERKLDRGWNLLSDIDMAGRVRYDEFFGDLDEDA